MSSTTELIVCNACWYDWDFLGSYLDKQSSCFSTCKIINVQFSDVNECFSRPCGDKSQCVDHKNRYVCICGSGFTGYNCEVGKKMYSVCLLHTTEVDITSVSTTKVRPWGPCY